MFDPSRTTIIVIAVVYSSVIRLRTLLCCGTILPRQYRLGLFHHTPAHGGQSSQALGRACTRSPCQSRVTLVWRRLSPMLSWPGVLLHRQIAQVRPNSVLVECWEVMCLPKSAEQLSLGHLNRPYSSMTQKTSSTSCGLKTKSQESRLRCLKMIVLPLNISPSLIDAFLRDYTLSHCLGGCPLLYWVSPGRLQPRVSNRTSACCDDETNGKPLRTSFMNTAPWNMRNWSHQRI